MALAVLSIAAPSVAQAQETMSYLSPNEQYTSETINNGGRLETYLTVVPPLPPGPGLVCTRIVIPVDTFLQPCSFFNYCPDTGNNGVIFVVRVRCRHINPVTPPPQLPHADTAGTLAQVLRAGTFQVTDVSPLPNSTDTVVAFGVPAGARYGLPSEFNGTCPANSVLITSPALQSLGNKSVCVQTAPTPNNALLQSQATQTFANLVANPDSADTGMPALRDLIESVMGTLVTAAVCRTDEQGHVARCLRAPSAIDFPITLGLTTGLCPVLPRVDLFNSCVSHMNQTPTGVRCDRVRRGAQRPRRARVCPRDRDPDGRADLAARADGGDGRLQAHRPAPALLHGAAQRYAARDLQFERVGAVHTGQRRAGGACRRPPASPLRPARPSQRQLRG